jgi:predicted transcriptional regulator
MSRTVSLAFRTREQLNAELESLAAATQRSKSWHIEQAL